MTVGELIEELKRFPTDAHVVVYNDSSAFPYARASVEVRQAKPYGSGFYYERDEETAEEVVYIFRD